MGQHRVTSPSPRREPAPPQNDAPTAALVAGILLAPGAPPTVRAVAPLLLGALPAVVLQVPAFAASVAEAAASVALRELPAFDAGSPMGELEARARFENVLVRGFYAVNVARRLGTAMIGPSGDLSPAERLAAAVARELPNLAAHREARERNLAASKKLDRARELYGDVLGWYHGENPGMPKDPRPTHFAANRKNWRPANGVPVSVGALPGVLLHCTCEGGPPVKGAAMLR